MKDLSNYIFDIRGELIREIYIGLKIGIENAKELLIRHEQSFGREHRSAKRMAETMDGEIKQMEEALNKLTLVMDSQIERANQKYR